MPGKNTNVASLGKRTIIKNGLIFNRFLLLFYGLSYFPLQNCCSRFWCLWVQFCLIVSHSSKIIFLAIQRIREWKGIESIIDFQLVWYSTTCLILYVNFIVHRREMIKLAARFRRFTPSDFDEPCLWSVYMIVLYFAALLIDFGMLIIQYFIQTNFWDQEDTILLYLPENHVLRRPEYFLPIEMVRIYCSLTATTGWIFMTFLVYIVHVYRFHVANKIFFTRYVHLYSAHELRIHWWRIEKVRDLDQKILSLLPFVWTANAFFRSFVIAVGSKVHPGKVVSVFDIILQYVIMGKDVVMLLIVICLIEWVNQCARRNLSRLKGIILKRNCREREVEKLMQEISSSVEFVATGSSLFTLNKSFILSFLSALISFSVLFMQLIS